MSKNQDKKLFLPISTKERKKREKTENNSFFLFPIRLFFSGFLLLFLINVSACQKQNQPQKQTTEVKDKKQESQLKFSNATLEQANSDGQTLWKIQAKETIYSQDQKKANLEKVTGNFFQAGEVVLQVTADKGEIDKDGEVVLLRENIIAIDPRNKTVIRGEQLEWHPHEDLLIMRQNITGSHPQLEISAKEARYYSRQQKLELIGQIVATSIKEELQMKTEHLWWEVDQEKLIVDKPVEIVRYQDKTVTDQIVANRLVIELKRNIAKFQENVKFNSLNPPVEILTNSIIWNYRERIIRSDKPIKIVHVREQISISANEGKLDQNQQIAYLKGKVEGKSIRNQAKLYCDELIWKIPSQIVEARGNINYQQVQPKLNLTGAIAVGKLQESSLVVSGNQGEKVETVIIP